MELNNAPIVSIACITFNQEFFIKDTLEGFLTQKTTFPFEIIIHDDASTDNTAFIIKEYVEKYPKLIIPIYQEENQYSKGINPGFRFVFPKCRGKYIAICEGDDYWIDPFKLQKQVNFLEQNPDYGLVFTDADHLNEETGNFIIAYDKTNKRKIPVGHVLEVLLYGNPFKTCTSMFKKEHISDLNAISELISKHQFKMGDKILWLIIAAKAKVGYIPISTVVYRIQSKSASHFQDINQFILFGKSSYKISLYFAEFYNLPISKCQLKNKYRRYIISKCITENHYSYLRHLICHPYLIINILIKEKLIRNLLIKY